jgi:hypothetical protein
LKYVDPSGHQAEDFDEWYEETIAQIEGYNEGAAGSIDWVLLHQAGVIFETDGERMWTISDMQAIFDGVKAMVDEFGGTHRFRNKVGQTTTFRRVSGIRQDQLELGWTPAEYLDEDGSIQVYDAAVYRPSLCNGKYVSTGKSALGWDNVIHELAHKWDYNHNLGLSTVLETTTGGKTDAMGYHPGGDPPPGARNRREDFAISVHTYLVGSDLENERLAYVTNLFSP